MTKNDGTFFKQVYHEMEQKTETRVFFVFVVIKGP